jgi:predicted transcriptional regulator
MFRIETKIDPKSDEFCKNLEFMKQEIAGHAVGLDRAQMSNIKAGKANPTLAAIEKTVEALGVTSDEPLK